MKRGIIATLSALATGFVSVNDGIPNPDRHGGRDMNLSMVRSVGALLLCTALSGCFDLEQRFVVGSDGAASFNVEFQLDNEILELSDDTDIDLEGTCDDQDFLEALPEGLKKVSDVRVEPDGLLCEYTVSGPLVEFEQLSTDMQRDEHNADIITLTILDDHRARLVSTYRFDGGDLDIDEQESAMARSIRRMIASNFEGHFIRWTVQAPSILESNGDIAADGRSVTWEIPLQQALVDGGEWQFEVILDYRNTRAQFF